MKGGSASFRAAVHAVRLIATRSKATVMANTCCLATSFLVAKGIQLKTNKGAMVPV